MPRRTGKSNVRPTVADLAKQREQDAKILAAALSGKSGVAIAAEMKLDRSTITRTLQRIWARTEQPMATELRAKWDMRIEAGIAAIWEKYLAGDIAAVHAFCRLAEQATKLHGLNQQFANDAGALADALLSDPEQRLARAIELRDELAEARARRDDQAATAR